MKHTSVTSSNIASIGYEDGVLEVTFLTGHTYAYSGVPPTIHAELMNAESVGSYFARNVKNTYKYEKVV